MTPEECGGLLDRYTALLLAADRPELGGAETEQLKGVMRAKVAAHPNVRACRHQVSRREYQCAMQAPNLDVFEQCLL